MSAARSVSSPRLVHLFELGRLMSAARDVEELLQVVTRAVVPLLDAERATLYIHNPAANQVVSKVATDLEIGEIRLGMGEGAAGIAAETRRPVRVDDARADPRTQRQFDERTGFETRALLCVPLLNLKKDLVGVLQVLNKRGGGAFTEEDERLLTAFGAYAAVCLEHALLAAQARDQERMAIVGRLASTIAHDIRNPLSIISGYAQLVAETHPDAREHADVICAEAERVSGMFGELLEFVRGTDEGLTVRPYSLGAFFAELFRVIERDFRLSGIRLETDIRWNGALPISRPKLLQACLNISGNAREAMGSRGVFTVAAREEDGDAVITFTDTGPGIPKEIRARLFEPFVTHGRKTGAGLGLAIAKKIVEAHGGSISAEDGPGEIGTRITIRLPIPREIAKPAWAQQQA
jgi:signal transduction histidine kinase